MVSKHRANFFDDLQGGNRRYACESEVAQISKSLIISKLHTKRRDVAGLPCFGVKLLACCVQSDVSTDFVGDGLAMVSLSW